jgi:WD40 repeat protein
VAIFAMAFSPDGKYLAAAGVDRIVYLFDAKTWNVAHKLTGQPEMISALAFSSDSRMLVTGGFSEFTVKNPVKVLVWEIASGKVMRSVDASQRVESVAFSPNARLFAVANQQKTVSVWTLPPTH